MFVVPKLYWLTMLWCIATHGKLYPNKKSSFEPFPDSVDTDTTWGSKKCINGGSRVTTMYKSQKHLHKRCVIVRKYWTKYAGVGENMLDKEKKSFYFHLSWTDFSATISVKGNNAFLQLCKITKKVRNMAKINHFLREHILVTSSFSTVFSRLLYCGNLCVVRMEKSYFNKEEELKQSENRTLCDN